MHISLALIESKAGRATRVASRCLQHIKPPCRYCDGSSAPRASSGCTGWAGGQVPCVCSACGRASMVGW